MPEPTIRLDALDLTGCTDAERAAILGAERLWIETMPADDGTTHGVLARVVDVPIDANPLDENDHRDRAYGSGEIIVRHGFRHWHHLGLKCFCESEARPTLMDWDETCGPLRFAEPDGPIDEAPQIGSEHGEWSCRDLRCGVLTYAAEWCPGCGGSHRCPARDGGDEQ